MHLPWTKHRKDVNHLRISDIPELTSISGLYLRRTILIEETSLMSLHLVFSDSSLQTTTIHNGSEKWLVESPLYSSVYRIRYPDIDRTVGSVGGRQTSLLDFMQLGLTPTRFFIDCIEALRIDSNHIIYWNLQFPRWFSVSCRFQSKIHNKCQSKL